MEKTFSLLCLTILACVACTDDLELDKLSSQMSLKPTILLPLANADVTTEYLFERKQNAVEYYNSSDGNTLVRLKSNHDSISAYPVMEALGFINSSKVVEDNIDLSYINFNRLNGQNDIDVNATIGLDISPNVKSRIKSLRASYEVTIEYTNFTHEAEINVDLFGDTKNISIGDNNSDGISIYKKKAAVIVTESGSINIPINVTAPTAGGGHWGEINLKISMTDIDDIECTVDGLTAPTFVYYTRTYIQNFKRIGRNAQYKNPKFWLSYTNSSEIGGWVESTVYSLGDSKSKTLDNSNFEFISGGVGQTVEFNKDNSNVQSFFKNVPDSVGFNALLHLTMPEGKETITISKKDTIYLGYRYEVPFIFSINGNIECDTMDINDIDQLEYVKRAKIVCTTTNGLPFEGKMIIKLANLKQRKTYSSIEIKDAMLCPTIKNGISVDTIGNVATKELSEKNLEDLRRSDAMIVYIHLNSKGKYVSPKKGDRLKIDASFAAGFEIEN